MPATEIVVLQTLITREIGGLIREVELLPEERLWQTLPGITNACGNLALHVAGNLQHFVGARLGETGYVRRRDHEFGARSGTRAEVVAELMRAKEVVSRVLPAITDAGLEAPFPEAVGGVTCSTRAMLTHLAVHAGMHLGQAGYLRRALTADATSANPVSVKELAGL